MSTRKKEKYADLKWIWRVLFIISAEILANFIRRDKDVKGFMTGEVEHKLSQFADDTTLILDG